MLIRRPTPQKKEKDPVKDFQTKNTHFNELVRNKKIICVYINPAWMQYRQIDKHAKSFKKYDKLKSLKSVTFRV